MAKYGKVLKSSIRFQSDSQLYGYPEAEHMDFSLFFFFFFLFSLLLFSLIPLWIGDFIFVRR